MFSSSSLFPIFACRKEFGSRSISSCGSLFKTILLNSPSCLLYSVSSQYCPGTYLSVFSYGLISSILLQFLLQLFYQVAVQFWNCVPMSKIKDFRSRSSYTVKCLVVSFLVHWMSVHSWVCRFLTTQIPIISVPLILTAANHNLLHSRNALSLLFLLFVSSFSSSWWHPPQIIF